MASPKSPEISEYLSKGAQKMILSGRCLNVQNLFKIFLKEMSGLTVRHFITRVDLFAVPRVPGWPATTPR
jgi:hypothetical protein